MRDPARIGPALAAIAEVWRRHPKQRLGQLLVNAHERALRERPCGSLFYVEDDELLRGLTLLDADMGPPRNGPMR